MTTNERIKNLEFVPLRELSERARALAKKRGMTSDDLAKSFGYKNYRSMRASTPWATKRLPITIIVLGFESDEKAE
jgi:hypothetical protein